MKRLTLMFSFLLALGLVTANAQSDVKAKKSCAKTCASAAKTQDAGDASAMAAAKLAAEDASIEKQVCEKSGSVSYVRLVKDAEGATSKQDVSYDAAKGQFVSLKEGKKACCAGGDKPSCCSKGKAVEGASKTRVKDTKKSSS